MPSETFISLIQNAFNKFAKRDALRFYRQGKLETCLTFEKLNLDTNQMAHYFLEQGVKKGDRVILFMDKSLLFVIAHLALQKIGVICVPLNPGFTPREISYFLKDASPVMALSGVEQGRRIQQVNPQLPLIVSDSDIPYHQVTFFRSCKSDDLINEPLPSDPGLIIYTSGTTGKPKGAVLTQGNLFHDCQNILETWAIQSEDTLCHALPLFHIHGLCFALHTCLAAGAKSVLLNSFDTASVITVLSNREGQDVCTMFMAVPAMYTRLVNKMGETRGRFNHLRLITSGSAPLLIKDFKQLTSVFGQKPVEREGMSETGMNFSNPVTGTQKPGSIGLPLPSVQVRVVNPETLTDVETGQIGEFWLKSPSITPGYWEKPDETRKAFSSGWFRTGDLGYMDQDGYYYLTDRMKNIIISGGENISPMEVETVINQLDDIAESAVVGIPDDQWGEKVVAAIVLKNENRVTEAVIQDHCKANLHRWKCPKQIRFVKALPKNTMGKILRDKVSLLFAGTPS